MSRILQNVFSIPIVAETEHENCRVVQKTRCPDVERRWKGDLPFSDIGDPESVGSTRRRTMAINLLNTTLIAGALAAGLIVTTAPVVQAEQPGSCSGSNCAIEQPIITLAQRRPGNSNGGFDGLRPEPTPAQIAQALAFTPNTFAAPTDGRPAIGTPTFTIG
jgi:hypothetical protein